MSENSFTEAIWRLVHSIDTTNLLPLAATDIYTDNQTPHIATFNYTTPQACENDPLLSCDLQCYRRYWVIQFRDKNDRKYVFSVLMTLSDIIFTTPIL